MDIQFILLVKSSFKLIGYCLMNLNDILLMISLKLGANLGSPNA